MKKGQLKALFIEAKGTGQKYIGVMIQTEGSSEPEVIINPKENFNAKFNYYMAAYDDDLILIAAKGKRTSESREQQREHRSRTSSHNSLMKKRHPDGKNRLRMRWTGLSIRC